MTRYQQRFDRFDRGLHGFLMLSFLGLALTGLPLLFADSPWAPAIAAVFGGYATTGLLHRIFAVILIAVFLTHVTRLARRLFIRGELGILWGPRSMVPQPRDVTDMIAHFRWFLGGSARPKFERYTYWEKFDYWAVFWGMGIIGGSGLMLWFPELFARFLPGWVFNIALVVHGEEALLAVGFIFTIHFFNSHLRPEKFPMDTVIFTGRIPEHELREERPLEYARLVERGELVAHESAPPTRPALAFGWFVGGAALLVGVVTVVLIVYSLFTR